VQHKVNYNYEILNPTIDDYKDLKVWSKAWPYIVTWRGPLAKRQRCIVIQDKERGWGTEQKEQTAYKEQCNKDEAKRTQRAG
jgi:hypothetical protein